MPHHNQSSLWKEGQSGNPNGRPKDARRPRTQEVIALIKSYGHKDPLETLSELQHNSQDEAIRATAANMLAPYLHSKLASTPVPPPPVYIEEAISLPRPTSIDQASNNIARLSEMKAQGQLDFATADSLINDNRTILYALIDEAKLLAAQGGSPQQTIRIENALPQLPGTRIVMPNVNGNTVEVGVMIEGPEPPDPQDFNGDPRPGSPPAYNDGTPDPEV